MNAKKTRHDGMTNPIKAIKVFLVTSMLAVTVGLWSVLSRQLWDTQTPPTQLSDTPYNHSSDMGLTLLPIPTIVPLQEVSLNGAASGRKIVNGILPTPARDRITVPLPTDLPPRRPIILQNNGPITSSGSSR